MFLISYPAFKYDVAINQRLLAFIEQLHMVIAALDCFGTDSSEY